MDFMEPLRPERVLILSGDHIYRMDYRKMLSGHQSQKADLTIAVMEVPPQECSRFGMVWADSNGEIFRFEEKPKETETRLASLGIYLFEWSCLKQALEKIVGRKRGFDFGKDVIPALIGSKRINAHRFDGYWRDVGTISSFYQTNMDVLKAHSGLDLMYWEICTNEETDLQGERLPTYFGSSTLCEDSLVSAGCRVEGTVVRSILSPGVTIAKNAIVKDSILMHGVQIAPHVRIQKAILDKNVQLGPQVQIIGGETAVDNRKYANCDLAGCTLIGKNVRIREGVKIGSNVVVESTADCSELTGDVTDGSVISMVEAPK
jgi:glucose-1-phosphate adenylyltransferase